MNTSFITQQRRSSHTITHVNFSRHCSVQAVLTPRLRFLQCSPLVRTFLSPFQALESRESAVSWHPRLLFVMADVLQTEDKVEEFLEYLEDWTPAVGVPLLSLSLMTRADTRRSNHILPAASRVCLPRLTHVSQERTAHTDLLITSCRRRIV